MSGLIDGIIDTIKDGIDQVGAVRRSRNARYLAAGEIKIARSVFEETVPYSKVYVTDGLGLGGRPYTLPRPGTSREYILHVGDGYYGMSLVHEDKKTLIHELTHVWQGEHSHWSWNIILSSGAHQIAKGQKAYDYDPSNMQDWDAYNPEQQAQIVEDWYGAGADEDDYRYHYIVEDILNKMMAPRPPVHEDVVLPVRSVAYESFPVASDDYITQLLARRYAANDVAGFGGRIDSLKEIFRRLDGARAHSLLPRLSTRRAGDKMSMYFHDHLSTSSRNTLLSILRTH